MSYELATAPVVEYCQEYIDRLHEMRVLYYDNLVNLQTAEIIVLEQIRKLLRKVSPSSKVDSRVKDLDGIRLKFRSAYQEQVKAIEAARMYPEGSFTDTKKELELKNIIERPFSYVKDILGFRIISSYSSDVPVNFCEDKMVDVPIIKNILDSFTQVGRKDAIKIVSYSNDAETISAVKGIHIICKLTKGQILECLDRNNDTRGALREKDAKFLSSLMFEIQIRTAAAHAWTIISHERLYKIKGARAIGPQLDKLSENVRVLQAGFDEIRNSEELWLDNLIDRLAARTLDREFYFDDGEKEKLFSQNILDGNSLKAYAMYQFYDVLHFGPTNDVSPLWIEEIRRCLPLIGINTVSELHGYLNSSQALRQVVAYRNRVEKDKKNIFKDATDWLSKCLIFASQSFRDNYPFGEETSGALSFEQLPYKPARRIFHTGI